MVPTAIISPMAITSRMAGRGALGADKHESYSGRTEVAHTHGHPTPKSRSNDDTLINLRAPIFVHSISPLFILL